MQANDKHVNCQKHSEHSFVYFLVEDRERKPSILQLVFKLYMVFYSILNFCNLF